MSIPIVSGSLNSATNLVKPEYTLRNMGFAHQKLFPIVCGIEQYTEGFRIKINTLA